MSWVYFLRSSLGQIKIGTTSRLRHRVVSLRASQAENIVFLGAIPGDRAAEQALHARFAHLRARGEWFHADDGLCRFIEDVVGRSDAVTALPAQDEYRPDIYSAEAMAWAKRLVALRMERESLSLRSARKAIQRDYGLVPGLFENLARGRIVSITAAAYFGLRDALDAELTLHIKEMRAELALVKAQAPRQPSLGETMQ